jgi:hypothetical protein
MIDWLKRGFMVSLRVALGNFSTVIPQHQNCMAISLSSERLRSVMENRQWAALFAYDDE